MEKMQKLNLRMQKLNLRMQKLNLRMQKLDFPGTNWRGLALIGAPKKNPAVCQRLDDVVLGRQFFKTA